MHVIAHFHGFVTMGFMAALLLCILRRFAQAKGQESNSLREKAISFHDPVAGISWNI